MEPKMPEMIEFITKMNPQIACDYVWGGDCTTECGHITVEEEVFQCDGNILNRPTFCPLREHVKNLRIPDISSDAILTEIIDELKYQIKSAGSLGCTPMITEFNEWLNDFITKYTLGTDLHTFASSPKVTGSFKKRLSESYQEASRIRLNQRMLPVYDTLTATARDGMDSAMFSVHVEVAKLVAEREGLDYDISKGEQGDSVIKIWGWV